MKGKKNGSALKRDAQKRQTKYLRNKKRLSERGTTKPIKKSRELQSKQDRYRANLPAQMADTQAMKDIMDTFFPSRS